MGLPFFWLDGAICASHSISLQDALIINISGKNQVILVFSAWGYVWSVVSLILLDWRIFRSAIKLETTNWYLFNFLHGDNHQWKAVFKTASLGLGVTRCTFGPIRFQQSLIQSLIQSEFHTGSPVWTPKKVSLKNKTSNYWD